MIIDFPVFPERLDFVTNYDLFMMSNGVYRVRSIRADNYLYPMYFLKDGDDYVISTSVYALIHYKKRFIRNPQFQTTGFFRPTFMTIDQEIMRERTVYRRSSLKLTDKKEIVELGAELIQDYLTGIEEKYKGYVHILQMGGKDSENIILTNRKEPWIVISGEPNASLNEQFIERNGIKVEKFISLSNETDNTFLLKEIIASDCMFDVAHFRWVKSIHDLVKKYDGRAVLWIGTSGDGIFSRNNNHRDKDYYAVHDLHVGMAMGIWHQMFKNLFNIPVVSPYQSPRFLDELFYRFDPYFVDRYGDVRAEIGEILFGKRVKYPSKNPMPAPWKRDRSQSIPVYVNQLKRDNIPCQTRDMRSWAIGKKEKIFHFINTHSSKRRSALSKVLFPLRCEIGKIIPMFRNKRHDITAREIK